MSEDKEQAVIEDQPDDQSATEPEGADAQDDDLDKILAEFDSSDEKVETTPEPQGGEDTLKKLHAIEQRLEQQQYQADMKGVVEKVRGDIPADVFDDVDVEAWVDAQARREPKLQKAWLNRHNDPKTFDRVVAGLGKKFASKFANLPDAEATEDRAAVTNAVRGSSNKAPEGDSMPDFASMTDGEARAAMKKMGIPDPGF